MTQSSEGSDLKSWREARGLTLAQAAGVFGIGGSNPAETYRRYEAGLVWPAAETIDLFVRLTDGEVTAAAMVRTRTAARAKEEAA